MQQLFVPLIATRLTAAILVLCLIIYPLSAACCSGHLCEPSISVQESGPHCHGGMDAQEAERATAQPDSMCLNFFIPLLVSFSDNAMHAPPQSTFLAAVSVDHLTGQAALLKASARGHRPNSGFSCRTFRLPASINPLKL